MKAKAEMVSCMNNAKWREFFEAIGENAGVFYDTPVLVKYLECDEAVEERLNYGGVTSEKGILEYWTHPKDPLQYIQKRFASWISYKDIEWLFFPTVIENDIYTKQTRNSPCLKTGTLTIETDISGIKQLLDNLGKQDYDLDEDGLKLYGYKWSGQDNG